MFLAMPFDLVTKARAKGIHHVCTHLVSQLMFVKWDLKLMGRWIREVCRSIQEDTWNTQNLSMN